MRQIDIVALASKQLPPFETKRMAPQTIRSQFLPVPLIPMARHYYSVTQHPARRIRLTIIELGQETTLPALCSPDT